MQTAGGGIREVLSFLSDMQAKRLSLLTVLSHTMVYDTTTRWGWIERWSPTAFIAAGILFLGTAALFGLVTFTDVSHPVWLTALFGLAGLVASFVGLLGLYPGLVDRVPRLARAGLVTVAIAGIALVAFPLCLLAKTSGIVLPTLPTVFFVIAMIATILGFLLFGVASLRTCVPSRTVGFLMLATVATFIVLFVADLMYGGSPRWLDFAVSGVQAVLLLTIGYALPTGPIPTEREDPQIDIISG